MIGLFFAWVPVYKQFCDVLGNMSVVHHPVRPHGAYIIIIKYFFVILCDSRFV